MANHKVPVIGTSNEGALPESYARAFEPLDMEVVRARGKAIVASPELTDGLAIADGKDMLVRSTPDHFAEAIVSLLGDVSIRERLGVHARATFVRDFSISSAEKTLRCDSGLLQRTLSSDCDPLRK